MTVPNDPHDPWQIAPPMYDAPPQHPGPMPRPKGADSLAVASLILGIVGLVSLPVTLCICPGINAPLPIAGLICGLVSKDRGGMRTAGVICSAVGLVFSLILLAILGFAMFMSP